jgi:hypothetical protein
MVILILIQSKLKERKKIVQIMSIIIQLIKDLLKANFKSKILFKVMKRKNN